MDCKTCLSISGQEPLSPAEAIFNGQYWLVEHAAHVPIEGWLVLVLKRHAEALHELNSAEWHELVNIQNKAIHALKKIYHSHKEYVACFAESEGFEHIHFHVIAKSDHLPAAAKGSRVFSLLQAVRSGEQKELPKDEVLKAVEKLRKEF